MFNVCSCSVAKLYTLCDPMDCSPPGSSVHGIFQARILESVAISSSRGSSWPRYQTCVSYISHIGGQILYHWATWETQFPISQQHLIHVDQRHLHLCSHYKEKKLFTKFSPIIESLSIIWSLSKNINMSGTMDTHSIQIRYQL